MGAGNETHQPVKLTGSGGTYQDIERSAPQRSWCTAYAVLNSAFMVEGPKIQKPRNACCCGISVTLSFI